MVSAAAADAAAPYAGRTVAEVIDELRDQGYQIAYSSRLVPADLTVIDEPASPQPINALLEILAAHGLTLRPDEGIFLVVRKPAEADEQPATAAVSALRARTMENIVVSASRYKISRDAVTPPAVIDQRTIQNMPDVGEDPVRVSQRLPGVAASGASARAHFRGGEQGEVGLILNGHRLFDPFHVRDYQNIFSAIDARAIEGVEVFTGGFPVRFGDRLSGLVVMRSLDSDEPRHTEIGISVFNTSVLHATASGDRQWLFSARRGNLDLVIDPKNGRPSYFDVFTQFAFRTGSRTSVAINALYADDSVKVVLETDPAELEEAQSRTHNAQVWLDAHTDWTDRLSSRTALSYTDYRNRRTGTGNDPQKLVASVIDDRDVRRVGFRQDWTFAVQDRHFLQWGFALGHDSARYMYDGQAEHFGLPALIEGQPDSLSRTLDASPDGGSYALYFADRWRASSRMIVEAGLRWDDQTYTGLSSDSQLSPRLNVLYRWRPDTDLRLSWGRYHQSQGIQELQIEDGIGRFWPAQRADHYIASVRHRFGEATELRIEAFRKSIRHVRPRFENLFDPLALFPELSADRVRIDADRAESNGLELSLEVERGGWAWWGSYTLSRAVDRINGRDERRSWDQRHAVQGGLAWGGSRWRVALAASAHTGWPTTDLTLRFDGVDGDGNPVFVAVPGPRNELRHNTFASIDFRVSREFAVRRGTLTAFVEVSNATNRRNVCCADWDIEEDDAGAPELERSDDFWLPILPAVGILWQF